MHCCHAKLFCGNICILRRLCLHVCLKQNTINFAFMSRRPSHTKEYTLTLSDIVTYYNKIGKNSQLHIHKHTQATLYFLTQVPSYSIFICTLSRLFKHPTHHGHWHSHPGLHTPGHEQYTSFQTDTGVGLNRSAPGVMTILLIWAEYRLDTTMLNRLD